MSYPFSLAVALIYVLLGPSPYSFANSTDQKLQTLLFTTAQQETPSLLESR